MPKGAVHERRKVAERGLTEGPGAPGETRRRDWAAQRNGIARGEEWRCQGQGESGNGRRKFLGISNLISYRICSIHVLRNHNNVL